MTRSKCFVPKCDTGSKRCPEKRHLFRPKKHMMETWNRLIPREDKELNEKSFVCNVHFDQRFILTTFDHVINGERVSIERGKWKLTDDAIPTLFPSCPKYLSKKIPKQRTCPTKRREAAAVMQQQQQEQKCKSSSAISAVQNNVLSGLESQSKPRILSTEPRPQIVAEEVVAIEMPTSMVDESISWQCHPMPLKMTTVPQVVNSLKSSVQELVLRGKVRQITGRYKKLREKMKLVKAELRTTKKRLSRPNKGKGIPKEMMNELSERQRNVIEHILKMSRCSEKRGIRFNSSWMLDCLLLRTRSASQYEFLRDNAYLPLPSRTTLARHIKAMGMTMGLDELLSRIDEKASTASDDDAKTHPTNISVKLRQQLAELVQNGIEGDMSTVADDDDDDDNDEDDDDNDAEVNM